MIYSNVSITFLCADDAPYSEQASIRLTDTEMVIDISAPSSQERAYLVKGHLVNNFYAGQDDVTESGPLDIVARWAELGDIWVGWWLEDGVEYLFSFRLPRNAVEPSEKAHRKSGRRLTPARS